MPSHGRQSSSRYESATTVYRDGQEYIRVRKKRRKRRDTLHKVVIGVLVALLVVLLAVGAYFLWFSSQLNNRLSLGDKENDIRAALTDRDIAQSQSKDSGYYVLLIGSDSRMSDEELQEFEFVDGAYSNQRSDIMVLARIDEAAKQITLLSIPRDTPWKNDQGEWGKLNAVYSTHGAAGIIAAVQQLTGVSISHYGEVHLAEFPQLVDSIGGITVDVPIALSGKNQITGESISLNPGVQRLNGQEATLVAQQRMLYDTDQDYNRQDAVRRVLQAIIKEIITKPAWEIPDAVLKCAECATTDMDAASLVRLVMALGSDVRLYQGTGPWEGYFNPNADGAWLCYQDPEGWSRVMDIVRSGGDPSKVDYSKDAVSVAGE